MPLVVSGLALDPDHADDAPLRAAAGRLRLKPSDLKSFRVERRSVDVRRQGHPQLIYSVSVALGDAGLEKKLAARLRKKQVAFSEPAVPWEPQPGAAELRGPVVVVGAGPAGLSSAWRLAVAGYRPLVLERGAPVEERSAGIGAPALRGGLDPDSNVCFGEGGAGCFSDGKLYTRRHDPRAAEFLALLVECGAPEEIMTAGRPHVGSDRLPGLIGALRRKIVALGGQVRTRARVDGLEVSGGRLRALRLAGGERLEVGACVLAAGASARDMFAVLQAAGADLAARPLQCGLRVECPQDEIDRFLYGQWAGHARLSAAEFFLTAPAGKAEAAAHTFCMCPGGRAVPVATEPGMLSTNGASTHARDSGFANAAVVTAVEPGAFGTLGPLGGVEFQRAVERRVFAAGGSDYALPCSAARAFVEGTVPVEPPVGPADVRRRTAALEGILPRDLEAAVRRALARFAQVMPPLGGAGAAVYAAETRVGSPVRVLRAPDGQAQGIEGLYPAGEGSGYAAGIMTSAIDGMKAAEMVVAAYRAPAG